MLTRAVSLGMKGLAITDHGPELGGRLCSPFFERLHDPVPGIRLLKGVEANLSGVEGAIDMPPHLVPWTDVVLLGLHENVPRGLGAARNTELVVTALRKNPCIDIISHPNDPSYPLDFPRLADEARGHGIALELNNSKTALKRCDDDTTRALIRACKEAGCPMVVSSDAHALGEIGCDDAVLPLLEREKFPAGLVVNADAARAFAFVDERRDRKRPAAR